jgi:hypothetical protein
MGGQVNFGSLTVAAQADDFQDDNHSDLINLGS